MSDNIAETSYPYHLSIRLRNFTVFRDALLDFVPGVNVLIGKNGSGKTHLMKALYAVQYDLSPAGEKRRQSKSSDSTQQEYVLTFGEVFQSESTSLVRLPIQDDKTATIDGEWGEDGYWMFAIYSSIRAYSVSSSIKLPMPRPIFVPAVDMIGHTRRFVSTYDEYQIDFDQTHRDIVALLLSPEKRENSTSNGVLTALRGVLGGEVEEENERFFLRTPQGRFAMPLVAEGLRKIATLYQLLKNGFLKPGDVLFWDEPEVNLNPLLMGKLIGVLLALAQNGVQIFLATHSYVILKELDLQSTAADKVRYFALEPTDDGTVVHATDDYAQIEPNAIADQYDSLYDRQITRSMNHGKSR